MPTSSKPGGFGAARARVSSKPLSNNLNAKIESNNPMNPQPDPIENFLIAAIAGVLRLFLTPFYYVARSDMGVQRTAVIPLLIPVAIHGFVCTWLSWISEANAAVTELYAWLMILGFVRVTMQARRRRRERDWSVSSWSSGKNLLEPVLILFSRAVYRKWGAHRWVRRMAGRILRDDFIYYVAEPSMLVVGAIALWSIGATLWFYPIVLAVALISVRSESQLFVYLKAHEVMDGKKLERTIKGILEEPASGGSAIPITQIPAAAGRLVATDNESVFNRLSPELQMLLMRDRAAQQ
jgi:hypothetical protein